MKPSTKIKNFCILGERNSGTNFLHSAIKLNFELKYKKICHKHFWRIENQLSLLKNTAILVIVRNIHDWINSMYQSTFHLQPELKNPKNKFDFLNKQFWSVYDDVNEHGNWYDQEIQEDRHLVTGARYKNIFQARYTKYNQILKLLTNDNSHIYLLKYEDLNEGYDKNLRLISAHYNLKFNDSVINKVNTYRGFKKSEKMINIQSKPKIFTELEITSHPDFSLNNEMQLGYIQKKKADVGSFKYTNIVS